MRLVIAEKPSVAQSLSRVLGASARRDGYLEGGGYLVSWCVGHLVELAPADSYDAKYSKWAYEDPLRVCVNQQHLLSFSCQPNSQICTGGCFANSTFLICNCDHLCGHRMDSFLMSCGSIEISFCLIFVIGISPTNPCVVSS